MAVLNYESTFGCLPPAYVADRDGRPMHSWRVLLLPSLEQRDLYDAYNFAQPWDGPDNARLADRMPAIYHRPEQKGGVTTTTGFVAVVGPRTAFPGARALTLKDIEDGTSKTILFVECANSGINWLEPRDLAFDRMSFRVNDPAARGINSPYGGARIALLDGMIRRLPDDTPPDRVRALLTRDGGEPIPELDW